MTKFRDSHTPRLLQAAPIPPCFFLAPDLLVLANSNMNSMTVQRRRYATYSSCQIKMWKEIQDDLAHIIAGLLRIARLLRTVRKRVYFGTTFDQGSPISVFRINSSRICYWYLTWFLTLSSFDLCDRKSRKIGVLLGGRREFDKTAHSTRIWGLERLEIQETFFE